MIGIYKITSPKGRVYIGQSKDIKKRVKNYKYLSCKKQRRLYSSFMKYGYEKHIFEVVCLCSIEELNEKERYYQELFETLGRGGLNCEYVSSKTGTRVLSEYSKKLIGDKNRGANNGMYGKKQSLSFKMDRRNHKHTKESLAKISKSSKGGKNPNAKTVLCLQTGVFYECIGDAAFALNIPYDRLKQWLNGRRKNKSSMVFA